MNNPERVTITLSAEMAAAVQRAVDCGDYASASEVVWVALREWDLKRSLRTDRESSLKAEIEHGLADIASGRVADFDVARIVERGRTLLAGDSSTATWPISAIAGSP